MRIILGPFHPDLEDAFAEEIASHKKRDLLCPLLVLTPSDSARRRLKVLLSREHRLALLYVQFLTFHQLAVKLGEEIDRAPLRLQSDLFLEEVLRQMIRLRSAGAEPFAGIEERAGGCAALWQTLRDLRDGMVDPAVALEALREGHFSRRAGERTAELLALLRSFQQLCLQRSIESETDVILDATRQAASSSYLRQFSEIFYYGFYDLTQLQLDFFHAVARQYSTTLFFPLLPAQPGHAAWSFAARFYERHLQGLDGQPANGTAPNRPLPATARLFDDITARSHLDFPPGWQCRITSAFGAGDEVTTAAKKILELVEDGGMPFHDIGVVARNLEPYGAIIKEIFQQHRIPLAGTFDEPLARSPLTKAVILLLNLSAKNFLRSQVIDLLSSPYFRFPTSARTPPEARPDLWDLATRELAICKGPAEWRRLLRYRRRDLELRQISPDDEPRKIRIPAAQMTFLAKVVEALAADLLRLPEFASWLDYVSAWKVLLQKYLGVEPDAGSIAGDADARARERILDLLEGLAGLDAIENHVGLADFAQTFEHWLERSSATEDRRNLDGVLILSATEARGLSFRALFVLGMNEGVFPRAIREDAFLRDRDREVLERDLGYKVSQKLAAFDEEKLLFSLLVGAAGERLDCSFQRADENGRALAPSWYLDELARALHAGGRVCETIHVPHGVIESATFAPFDRENLLLPRELAIRLALEGRDPTALVELFSPLAALYKQGRAAVAAVDRSGDRLLPYDGLLTGIEPYWKHFSGRGLSPTALETYARCPFRFFARHVLGLEPLDHPEETVGPSPAEFGELGHAMLNAFYRTLMEDGYFSGKAAGVDVESVLQRIAAQAFADYEEHQPVGYPLAWETLKAGMVETLRQVIAADLDELAESGFAPAGLESDMSARLAENWPEPLGGSMIGGRMDRIDAKPGALRVIDYKFKLGAKPAPQDRNLVRAALRGERLQPPFYYLLAQRWAEQRPRGEARPAIEAAFYYIAPRWPGGPLVSAGYGAEALAGAAGAETRQTIAALAGGVRGGRFFMIPGEYCGHCDAAPICRKNHPPSLWRAENDARSEALRALRRKALVDDEREPDADA